MLSKTRPIIHTIVNSNLSQIKKNIPPVAYPARYKKKNIPPAGPATGRMNIFEDYSGLWVPLPVSARQQMGGFIAAMSYRYGSLSVCLRADLIGDPLFAPNSIGVHL